MAAITTKATLETEISNWLKRTDLTGQYDIFEQMAEEMFRAPVRAPRDPEISGVRIAMTRSSGSLSTSNPYISRPSDFLEPVTFRLTGDGKNLTWIGSGQLHSAMRTGSGQPSLWTVNDVVHFDIQPDSAYAYEFTYYQSATSIVGGATSAVNGILSTYPMVYLSAVLHFAHDYNGDDDNAGKWLGRYKVYVDSANRTFQNSQRSLGPIASYTDYSTP